MIQYSLDFFFFVKEKFDFKFRDNISTLVNVLMTVRYLQKIHCRQIFVINIYFTICLYLLVNKFLLTKVKTQSNS
jgi:hypothetical protein